MTKLNEPSAIQLMQEMHRMGATPNKTAGLHSIVAAICELAEQVQTLQHNPWNSEDAKIQEALVEAKMEELQQEKIEQANQVVRDFKRAGLVEKTFCGLKPGQTYNGPDGNKWTFTQEGNPTASPEEKVLELCGNQPEGVVPISFRLFSELIKSIGPNVEIAYDQSITVLTSQGERKVRPSKDVGYEIKTPAATTPSAPPANFDAAIEILQVQLAQYRYLAEVAGVSNVPANLQVQKSYEAAIAKLQAPAVPAADVSYFIERLKHAIQSADDNEDGDTVAVFDGVYEVTELQAVLAILQRNNK